MALFKKRRKKRSDSENRARLQRRSGDPSKTSQFFETSRVVGGLLFVAFSALVFVICFVGNAPRGPQILEGQLARLRVVAEFSFSYESDLATEQLKASTVKQVPSVYRLSMEPYASFESWIKQLDAGLRRLVVRLETSDVSEHPELIRTFASSLALDSSFSASPEDIAVLLQEVAEARRSVLFNQALEVIRDVFEQGIYEPDIPVFGSSQSSIRLFNIINELGTTSQVNVLPYTEALFSLRQSLIPISPNIDASRALFGIFRTGLSENLKYDESATEANVALALLKEAVHVLANVPGIKVFYFDKNDVVRHPLVQRIINAYERYQSAPGRSDFNNL